MRYKLLLLFMVTLFISCTEEKENNSKADNLTEKDKSAIENFSKNLTDSINTYNAKFLMQSWDQNSLIASFSGDPNISINASHKQLKDAVKNQLTTAMYDIININEMQNGIASLNNIVHKSTYSEIYISFILKETVDFLIFKINIIAGNPKITDIKYIRDNEWYSSKLLGLTDNLVTSEREDKIHKNRLYYNYEYAINNGDYGRALNILNEINEIDQKDYLIIQKLLIAQEINEETYKYILDNEAIETNNLYLTYLFSDYYQDHQKFEYLFNQLNKLYGNCIALDSLKEGKRYW